MLSSQITLVVQTSVSPTSSIALPAVTLRSSRGLNRISRPGQQIRSFRFGLWSSYLDLSFEKEIKRRQRMIKHKYVEAINRKLSWQHHHDYVRSLAFKSFMCSARPSRRWMPSNLFHEHKPEDRKREVKDENENISEDWLHSILRRRSAMYDATWPQSMSSANGKPEQNASSTRVEDKSGAAPGYDIDPITNRKVFKSSDGDSAVRLSESLRKSIEVPVKTFKGPTSRFSNLEPPCTSSDPMKSAQKTTPVEQALDAHDAKRSTSTDEGLESFDSKMSYNRPFGSAELDQKAGIEEGLRPFDTKMSYGKPHLAHEPDGKYAERPASTPVKNEVGQPDAKAFVSNDVTKRNRKIDGSDSVSKGLKEFDSRMSYDKPFLAHEPDGKYAKPAKSDSVQDGLKAFDAKMSYDKPFLAYEPNRMYTSQEEQDSLKEGLKSFDSKMSYDRPHTVREQDGKLTKEAKPAEEREYLKEYEKRFPYPESKTRLDMEDARLDCNGPEKPLPLYYDEPFGKEPIPNPVQENPSCDRSWVKLTEAEKFTSRAALDAAFEGVAEEQPSKHNIMGPKFKNSSCEKAAASKMTGNFVRDFPEEFKTNWRSSETSSGALMPETKTTAKSTGFSSQTSEIKVQKAEKDYIEGLASKESFHRHPSTPRIQTSLDRGSVRSSPPLERDARNLETSDAKAPAHRVEEDLSESASDLGTVEQNHLSNKKPFKTSGREENVSPVDQEFSIRSDNLRRELKRIYEEKYGAITRDHRQAPEKEPSSLPYEDVKPSADAPEPTMYKILAYDPTMQSVSMAETTSVVPDGASPLTPAEVLLRISNPAKFFPYFEEMKMQGFEIVSGSGDVLVFRKVRPANEPAVSPEQKRRNPIDGMEAAPIAATGNFASPTGFVNHDLPPPVRDEPRFKSNIDMRREEPVFSGKRNWYDDHEERRRTPGLGRRLVTGAVWVGALCYASGVVIEFFTTGGADGLGAQGF